MTLAPALLVKVSGDGRAFAARSAAAFGAASAEPQPILSLPPGGGDGMGLAGPAGATWMRVSLDQGSDANPWDQAHALIAGSGAFSASDKSVQFVEPDIQQQWPTADTGQPAGGTAFLASDACAFDPQTNAGGRAVGDGVAWNFGSGYSELAAARRHVGEKLGQILIAHLDTGYDPAHITLPAKLQRDLQRNFVVGEGAADDASDHVPQGGVVPKNRGHGTGTLSLLAGNRLDGTSPNWPGFTDYLGGAALARIMPVRIADWVVRFSTSTMVQGFGYAQQKGAHVLSMSMGGLSSHALVDAVNLAYESGLVMVTAAGNNYAYAPTPKSTVFPARLQRVLAACGVMADGRAYAGLSPLTMQGNFGPAEKMATSLGAYTPNVPWAKFACGKVVDMDGAGTSAATPQIASAAALWLAQHWKEVSAYPEPWMRIEAVRHALFTAARKSTARMDAAETLEKLGNGVVQADAALAVLPLDVAALRGRKLPRGEASWSWLNLIFGGGVSLAEADAGSAARRAMLCLELTQMAQRVDAIDEAIDDPGRHPAGILAVSRNRYLEAALDLGQPSRPLRTVLESLLSRRSTAAMPSAGPLPAMIAAGPSPKRAVRPRIAPMRRLRVFALDPSVAQSLSSVAVNQTVLSIPWDADPLSDRPLAPGPVGEYLEVVDVDPASGKVYDPVDLNHPFALGQDGWPPSEGDPQFHQQMVYAVGMATIRRFEQALGRRALWAPHYSVVSGETSGPHEVRRLRIYPHALRTDNAYYSPAKVALLFGYFPAASKHRDATAPGTMVFSCLSSDIIAHEMTHALLDGLHRRLQEASNPDVPAFHEAFADLVALFQHFDVVELVRFEIGRVRGVLSAARLLGGLAKQFGEGTARCGPLRDYAGDAENPVRYGDSAEAHKRGAVLVFAVYEAFLAIVGRRTADLVRLASNGTGVLAGEALHPDLVERLTTETCKSARHVLQMCIRALDYCPAVDITFGEYLRAIITADVEILPTDRLFYRVAFIEAFRNRGIVPSDVRTMSEQSLTWNSLADPTPPWLPAILDGVDVGWDLHVDRTTIFRTNEENRWSVWRALKRVFKADPSIYSQFGLVADLPRFDRDGKVISVPAAGETTFDVFSVRPARRVGPDGSFLTDIVIIVHQRRVVPLDGVDPANGWFWFRGGATLLVDPRKGHETVRYCIVKNAGSASRMERQRATAGGQGNQALRSLYFGATVAEPFALLHAEEWMSDDA